jgi:hypothetical protein
LRNDGIFDENRNSLQISKENKELGMCLRRGYIYQGETLKRNFITIENQALSFWPHSQLSNKFKIKLKLRTEGKKSNHKEKTI